MRLESLKRFALSLPSATMTKQWGDNLVFKIGGKMFFMLSLDGDTLESLCFKTSPDEFKRLTDFDGIIPAPYLARASWVALEDPAALRLPELERLIAEAYQLVRARLTKKVQASLASAPNS